MSVSVLFLFRFWRLLQKAVHIISHTHLLLLLLVLPPPPPPPKKKKKKKKLLHFTNLQCLFHCCLTVFSLPESPTGFFFIASTAVTSGELSKYVPIKVRMSC